MVRAHKPLNLCCRVDFPQWACSHLGQEPRGIFLFPTLATQLTSAWNNVHASLWLHYFKGVTYFIQTHENFGQMHTLS